MTTMTEKKKIKEEEKIHGREASIKKEGMDGNNMVAIEGNKNDDDDDDDYDDDYDDVGSSSNDDNDEDEDEDEDDKQASSSSYINVPESIENLFPTYGQKYCEERYTKLISFFPEKGCRAALYGHSTDYNLHDGMIDFATEFESHEDFYLAWRMSRLEKYDLEGDEQRWEQEDKNDLHCIYIDASLSGPIPGLCQDQCIIQRPKQRRDTGTHAADYAMVTLGCGYNANTPRSKPFLYLPYDSLFASGDQWLD